MILGPGWRSTFLRLMRKAEIHVTVGIHASDADRSAGDITNPEAGYYQEFGRPERSFLREPFDRKRAEYIRDAAQWYGQALRGIRPIDVVPELIGTKIRDDIKSNLKDGISPPLAPSTQRQRDKKGQGSTPLLATGQLVRAVDYKVKE
jgi:hypothetical protein